MSRLAHRRTGHFTLPPLGAWLWGAVEYFALLRSRWSLRSRRSRQA